MASANLLEAVLTDGIRDTHFFNGRLLTAEDLRTMQRANQLHHAQLGRAIGDGVAYGFEVTLAANAPVGPESNATVHVTAGLAFNPAGEATALRKDTDVRLTAAVDEETPEGRFTVCEPPAPEFTNIGFYILTVAPAEGLQGRAPMTELGAEGIAGKCASKYSVEGVRFRMFRVGLPAASTSLRGEARDLSTFVQFQLPTLGGAISTEMFKLRNEVANLCFGTDRMAAYARNPLETADGASVYARYGVLDDLRDAGTLTRCEVPIALLFWSARGIEFIDAWAVRRPLVVTSPSAAWVPLVAARRRAEALAAVLQFQDQLRDILAARATTTAQIAVRAVDYFRFLPPLGLVPEYVPDRTGLNVEAFAYGRPHREPEFIDGAQVKALADETLGYPPIDLSQAEMIWLYRPWQNRWAFDHGEPVPSYVLFTSAHVGNRAIARFDVARWDYSNFARCDCDAF